MKTIFAFSLILLIWCAGVSCYAQSTVQQLERYLKQVNTDSATPIPPAILSDFKSEKALLENLFSHQNDPGEQFQFRVLDLVRLIGLKSKNPQTRSSAVDHFIRLIPSKNLRISGMASEAAAQFGKSDFSEVNKDSLVNYLRIGVPNLDVLFRLAGFLEPSQAKTKISSMVMLPMSPRVKWSARLALARLGDQSAINFILERIASTPVDDEFVSSLVPGLVYTRNKKVFAQLDKILQSDSYSCSSSHPDSKSTVLCAYRILESMAGAIEKFPINVDESGDLLVDNYQTALETARRWLKQNPDYGLKRNAM